LPAPAKTGGMPLRDALAARKSVRDYAPGKTFNPQQLSDMLWAASGVSRADGRLTAPTARNWQEITLYVATAQGVYRYDPKAHKLALALAQDIRAQTGKQPFVGKDTIEIVMVAEYDKMTGCAPDMLSRYAWIDSGYVSQNLYLHAAANGFATVVRAMVPRPEVAALLKLDPAKQEITVVQTVGFPAVN
ncbi:MAG: SagB/ThcOx family dehydrogenase, partial [Planctomycetes bacterium]|nr:SagB/ThcOx family dehydrogenase [Planctomycetota bacterium]